MVGMFLIGMGASAVLMFLGVILWFMVEQHILEPRSKRKYRELTFDSHIKK